MTGPFEQHIEWLRDLMREYRGDPDESLVVEALLSLSEHYENKRQRQQTARAFRKWTEMRGAL
jgi:hypothetical protein